MMKTIAVVGAGQVAAVAARALRRRGFDGRIEIIGDESHRPYQRPPLSKEYLDDGEESDLFLLPQQWCAEHDVRLRLGSPAVRVRPEAGAVELADGTEVEADRVLLATGGRARRLPETHGERVHYLRTLDDSDRLRGRLRPGARVIVIGAGFIGAEVASTARARGAEVVLIEAMDAPLENLLGAEVGAACAEIHRRAGVDLRLGESVHAVEETATGVVVTTSGARVEGDAVVVGIGSEPNIDVAVNSGIAVHNGILVDAYCRTSMPGVFAAGDIANQEHPLFGGRIRVEHFDNANRQARATADSILDRGTGFDDPHWFWSDQYEFNLQHTGHSGDTDQVVVRGSVPELDFTAFYLRRGRIRAAFGIDRGGDVLAAKELISARASLDAATLRDEDVDLMEPTMLQEQV